MSQITVFYKHLVSHNKIVATKRDEKFIVAAKSVRSWNSLRVLHLK